MKRDTVPATIQGVMPTSNGCAVFLGAEGKTFVIYVDPAFAPLIQSAIEGERRDRPLTHDLIRNILLGLETTIEHVVINDVDEGVFFARILLKAENEVVRKLVEIDARPSDSIVLALHARRPIHVARSVLARVDDMSEILARILRDKDGDA